MRKAGTQYSFFVGVLSAVLLPLALLSSACTRSGNTFDKQRSPTSPQPASSNSDGGWISSGGELIGNGHNPWFLANTAEVRYCIKHDAQSFSATEETFDKLINKAFTYWQEEFDRIRPYYPQPIYAPMGKNKLVRVPCDGKEDIAFLAGLSQLNEQQRRFIKQPKSYLALAVRTSYNERDLRGQGFIFVASDIGGDAYRETPKAAARPWSKEGLLFRVLLHELGHVFGIPHTDQESGIFYNNETKNGGVTWSLMQQNFPEHILSYSKDFERLDDIPTFFGFATTFESCKLSDFARSLFKLGDSQACLALRTNPQEKKGKYFAELYVKTASPQAQETLVANIPNVEHEKPDFWTVQMFALINVKVTPEQRAISLPPNYPNTVSGPGLITMENNAEELHLMDGSGRKFPILIRIEPHRFVIMTTDENGKIVRILD